MNEYLPLSDGATVGVIGGGPAGSLFSYLVKNYSKSCGLDLNIVMLDGKSFFKEGCVGCNMCAGVISQTLDRKLSDVGIHMPGNVAQRYIRGYVLETKAGILHLEKKTRETITTVYRGRGPKGSSLEGMIGFDEFLMSQISPLVDFVPEYVREIELKKGGVRLKTRSREIEVDVAVVASGLNTKIIDKVNRLGFGYQPPKIYHAIQSEIPLDEKEIQFRFGDYIYSYILGIPNIEFAAIIPKSGYLTVSLVGKVVKKEEMINFLSHPRVLRRFPPGWEVSVEDFKDYCHCSPKIPVTHSQNPYTDRFVVIGDANCARLFKNGLESAFITAELAARTIVSHGVSKRAFEEQFYTGCQELIRDNNIGRLLFKLNTLVSKNPILSGAQYSLALEEQLQENAPLNDILWDMMTGNDSYHNIFKRVWQHGLILRLLSRIVKSR